MQPLTEATDDSQGSIPTRSEWNGWAPELKQLWDWDASKQVTYPNTATLPLQVTYYSLVKSNTEDPLNLLPLQYEVIAERFTSNHPTSLTEESVPSVQEATKISEAGNGDISDLTHDDEKTRR